MKAIEELPNFKAKDTGWFECNCPFCGDTHRHLQIAPGKNWAKCLRCDKSVPIQVVLDTYNLPPDAFEAQVQKALKGQKRTRILMPIDKDCIDVWECPHAVKYLTERGALATAMLNDWKYAMRGDFVDRIVIPIVMAHKLQGYIARSLDPKEKKYRYLFSSGFKSAEIWYNYDNARGHKIIVINEGVFDVIATAYALPFAGVVGCFGKSVSTVKAKLIKALHPDEVVIMLDSPNKDERIEDAIKNIMTILKSTYKISCVYLPESDPSDTDPKIIQDCFYDRQILYDPNHERGCR